MIINDERTEEQKKTHSVLITATDRFLSGWGCAEHGISKCAWACKPEHANNVFRWVRKRREMKYVNYNKSNYKPRHATHFSVYVVDDKHRALTSD